MKKYYQISLLAVILVLFLGSCENNATVDPPPFEKKAVIISLITPLDDSVRALLTYTQPYYGVEFGYQQVEFVLGATITVVDLTDPSKAPLTLKYKDFGVYSESSQNLPILSGHDYRMDVTSANGDKYYAITHVPPAADLTKFKINFLETKDDISSSNYYNSATLTLNMDYTGFLDEKYFISPVLQSRILNDNNDSFDVDILFEDRFFQGEGNKPINFLVQQEFVKQSWSGMQANGPWTNQSISGTIYTCDLALKNYNLTENNANNFPGFFTEPQPLLWNFKGGALGVFGGYNFVQGVIWKK